MNIKNKIIGASVCAALALSCSSCAAAADALTVAGENIRAGIYLYYEYQAMNEAMSKLKEEQPDLDTSAEGFDYFAQTVGGMSYSDYVVKTTKELCQEYVYVNNKFDELQLSFTEDERKDNYEAISSSWYDENAYLQYYGISEPTMGEYYENRGIGKQSYTDVYNNSEKREKIFHAYYAEDGLFAVTQDEINNYLKENHAKVKYITVNLKDADGNALETDEGKKLLKDLADGYAQSLNSGTSFNDVYNEYQKYLWDQSEAAKKADDAEYEITEYTRDDKEDSDYETVLNKDSTSPSEEFVSYVFAAEYDKASVMESEDAYYVIVRSDVLSDSEWVENNKENAVHEMRGDEFDNTLSTESSALAVTENAAAMSAYAPKKVHDRDNSGK